ncbi:MAG: hypothetical protein ACU0BF_12680 [Paracoccaceae bacterium]
MHWLMRAAMWARRPPSWGRVVLVVGVIAACLALLGAERLGLTPDWMATERMPRGGGLR